MLRVTVDTNVLSRDLERMRAAADGLDVEIAPTTVTLRERGDQLSPRDPAVAESGVYDESRYDSGAVYADTPPVVETGVWNESRWGHCVWGGSAPVSETWIVGESPVGMAVVGGDDSQPRFELILAVIGSGSFPKSGERADMTPTQRRQLRDAMILEAHARERRDVLVSRDAKAFINHGRRERLEALCRTRIRTVDEFCADVAALAASTASDDVPPGGANPRDGSG